MKKKKEVTEINEGAISGIFESTSRDYIFIFLIYKLKVFYYEQKVF